MHLVGAPLLGRFAVDWTPHLLRAGGANGALSLVEFEYLGLEVQTAMVEQASDLGFGVVHHTLVEDAVDAPRQHGVDMRHQPDVIGIISADVTEIVAEVLPAREMLPEIGKAAAQRVASRVDDLGIGQDEMNERYEQPVVGQLVDEERPVGPALN